MEIIVVLIGLIIGAILSVIINKISCNINTRQSEGNECEKKDHIGSKNFMVLIKTFLKEIISVKLTAINILIIFISALLFIISFKQMGLNMMFFQAVILDSILIVVSFIDIEHKIIPNKIIIVTLIMGGVFYFTGNIPLVSAFGGMLVGGGILFILALIPSAMGGGDIKLMFALGMFLGYKKSLLAICLAFILAAIISVMLLVFKIKGRKEYIPFGPFLALGTFIAFHFNI